MNLTPFVEPLAGFLARHIVRREALFRDASGTVVIPHPSIGMLYALRGAGKTMTALDLGLRVAAAAMWGPYVAEAMLQVESVHQRRRRVLFVDGEMPEADLQERLRAMTIAPDLARAQESCFLLGSDRLAAAGQELNLSKEGTRRSLTAIVEELGVDFMVLDNWVSLMHDLDENDNAAIGPVARWLARLRHDGASVLLVHHAGKEGQQRGASAREDVLDYSIRLRPMRRENNQRSRWSLEWDKVRGGMPEPAKFHLQYDGGVLHYSRTLLEEALVRLRATPGQTADELAASFGQNRAWLDRHGVIRELSEAGLIAGTSAQGGGRGRPSTRWSIAPLAPAAEF